MSGASYPNAALNNIRGIKPNGSEKVSKKENLICEFQMPLHYPRYKKSDYEKMPEWKLDCLLREYGLPIMGDVKEKRNFAMGAFLWPCQIQSFNG
ncbi:hypothetical protein UlMin_002097 [Ulmus minor]